MIRRIVGPVAVAVVAGAAVAGEGAPEVDELAGFSAETRRVGRRTGGLGSDPPPTTRSSRSGLEVSELGPRPAAVDGGVGRPVAEARDRIVRAGPARTTGVAFCLPFAEVEADEVGGLRL